MTRCTAQYTELVLHASVAVHLRRADGGADAGKHVKGYARGTIMMMMMMMMMMLMMMMMR